jgi:hypothetical protein
LVWNDQLLPVPVKNWAVSDNPVSNVLVAGVEMSTRNGRAPRGVSF